MDSAGNFGTESGRSAQSGVILKSGTFMDIPAEGEVASVRAPKG
ncbi:MAG TPA: hypothetical protein VKA08_17195 [Balneolales bacterium]|nr:hypothetical protein [Balneolales bacterium]